MGLAEFRKLGKSVLRIGDDKTLFQSVWLEVAQQVEERPFVVNAGKLAEAPSAARTVYWLWLFQSEAVTGGITGFILDALGCHTPEIVAALEQVGAEELVRRVQAAIPLARDEKAEFTGLDNHSWFDQFEPKADYPTLSSVDRGVLPFVRGLTGLVAQFIRSNVAVLFEGD